MAAKLKNTPYRLVPLSRVVLLKLYLAHINDDPRPALSASEVVELFPTKVSSNLVRSALELLRGSAYDSAKPSLVARVGAPEAHKYKLNERGIFFVEEGLRQKESDLNYFLSQENEEEALDHVAGVDAIFWTPTESIETQAWVPLELDRTSVTYTETVAEVEKAVEVIRGDNGFATAYPSERAGILASLEEGLTWLKDRIPTRAQIVALLVNPFRWIATTFASGVIGEAAKKAGQRLVDFLAALW